MNPEQGAQNIHPLLDVPGADSTFLPVFMAQRRVFPITHTVQTDKNPRRLYPALDAKGKFSIKARKHRSKIILSRGYYAEIREQRKWELG